MTIEKYVCRICRRQIGHIEPEIPAPMPNGLSPICRYDFRQFVCIDDVLYCKDCVEYDEKINEYKPKIKEEPK